MILGDGSPTAGHDFTALDVNLFFQGDPGRLPTSHAGLRRAMKSFDCFYYAVLARGVKNYFIPHAHLPAGDQPGNDPAIIAELGEPIDVLHRHAERLVQNHRLGFKGI